MKMCLDNNKKVHTQRNAVCIQTNFINKTKTKIFLQIKKEIYSQSKWKIKTPNLNLLNPTPSLDLLMNLEKSSWEKADH